MAPRKASMELVEHLNSPEVHIIAKSGHMLPQEAPNICRQLLKTFIFANNPS
jgi:pimeloyl-ACP methyl ester carboxylesterase